jgi:hypothetical protein
LVSAHTEKAREEKKRIKKKKPKKKKQLHFELVCVNIKHFGADAMAVKKE